MHNRPLTLDYEPLEMVEKFTYLGSLLSTDNAANKKKDTFWKSLKYFCQTLSNLEVEAVHPTKVWVYNWNIKLVLLYSFECWGVIQNAKRKLDVFYSVWEEYFWSVKISYLELYKKLQCGWMRLNVDISDIMDICQQHIIKVVLTWTPPARRKEVKPISIEG